jgi:hypothetical protein
MAFRIYKISSEKSGPYICIGGPALPFEAATMKKDETKRLVLQEWDDWAARNLRPGQKTSGTDGLIFFWVTVHGWLVQEGKIIRTEPS